MEKQKKQMFIIMIILIILICAYFAISRLSSNVTTTDDGPNASLGNVTEAVLSTETEEATE